MLLTKLSMTVFWKHGKVTNEKKKSFTRTTEQWTGKAMRMSYFKADRINLVMDVVRKVTKRGYIPAIHRFYIVSVNKVSSLTYEEPVIKKGKQHLPIGVTYREAFFGANEK